VRSPSMGGPPPGLRGLHLLRTGSEAGPRAHDTAAGRRRAQGLHRSGGSWSETRSHLDRRFNNMLDAIQSGTGPCAAGSRLRAILESALDGVITMNQRADPRVQSVADRCRLHASASVGATLAELIIPASLPEARGGAGALCLQGVLRLGRRWRRRVGSDGSEFPVELAITRIGLEAPRPHGSSGTSAIGSAPNR